MIYICKKANAYGEDNLRCQFLYHDRLHENDRWKVEIGDIVFNQKRHKSVWPIYGSDANNKQEGTNATA